MLGSTVGGTSVTYAGSLERPERHDLEDAPGRPHPTGGWAAGYDAFRPHFEAVERAFHVCGEPDPLSAEARPPLAAPPEMSPGDTALVASFRRRGLHPYRAHLGIRYLPGCAECIGRDLPGALQARRAHRRRRARARHRARGAARRLRGDGAARRDGRVTHLEARRGGAALTLAARCVVLAAGGLASPRLLLASASEAWPDGLANRSGLVGRNLMFHLSERLAVWPERRAPLGKPAKTISLRDFYFRDGMRLGMLQSMGLDATYGNVVHHLNDEFDRAAPRGMRPLRGALRVPAWAASRVLRLRPHLRRHPRGPARRGQPRGLRRRRVPTASSSGTGSRRNCAARRRVFRDADPRRHPRPARRSS